MHLVEQHIIKKDDPRYGKIDAAALASKNLWNEALYLVRQAFIFQQVYLGTAELYHQIKSHEAYQALPRKVSNQVLLQLHGSWKSFFEATAEYAERPEKFVGRPKLPKYKHKTEGRHLLIYEWKAVSKRALKRGMISLTELGDLVPTKVSRDALYQVRIVPKGTYYVIEVIYEQAERQADVDPALFASLDPGVNNLAALTSNVPGFVPVLVNGCPLKSINRLYNKQRARANRFTSQHLDALTDKRNRRVQHYLLWKQEVEMDKRNNQSFVQIPHARFIEMLQYKAALVGIEVKITEEAYTSQASFLDLDEIPPYEPQRKEPPRFHGRRITRGMYRASGKRLINADVNGSYNIARKVFPAAFGQGIAAPAVEPIRLAVK